MSSNQNSSECPICLADMGKGAALFTTACGHQFHFECFSKISQSGNFVCPICRANVPQLNPAHIPQQQQFQQQIFAPQQQFQQQLPQQQFQQQIFAPQQLQQIPHHRNIGGVPLRFKSFDRDMPNHSYIPDEDPLDPIIEKPQEKPNNNNNNSEKPSETNADQDISATVDFEFDMVPSREKKSIYGMCSLTAPKGEQENSRSAMDVVCVIDKSGSMSGGKIELLKLALKFVVSQLSAQDRISIVEFNSTVNVLCGLRKCQSTTKQELESQIGQIQAGGGTDIITGLRKGMQVLSERKNKNVVSSVLLLTDGQDSHSAKTIQQMRATEELGNFTDKTGASIHCFGFGANHDAKTMSAIAECVNGTFTYVEDNDSIGPSFATILGGLMSVVAQNIVVQLTAAEGTKFEVFRTSYSSKISPDQKTATVSLPDLFSEEERDIIFTLSLGECSPSDKAPVLQAQVSWKGKNESQTSTISATGYLNRPEDPKVNPKINIALDIQRNRSICTEAMEKALDYAQKGEYKQATETFNNAIKVLSNSPSADTEKVQNLIKDLKETARDTENRQQFSQGGFAKVKQKAMMNTQQRACYSKAPVYSNQMNSCQAKNNVAWSSYSKNN